MTRSPAYSPDLQKVVLRNLSPRKGTTSYEVIQNSNGKLVPFRSGKCLSVDKYLSGQSYIKPCEVLSEADDDI